MRSLLLATAIMALFIAAATFARAQDADGLGEAKALFAAGDYLPAAEKARAVGGAQGLALAAQITSYYSRYVASEEERLALYKGAVEMAAAALELDADNAFVRVQNAHALGRYSQQIGVVEAIGEGLAGRVREQIDAALALDPDNASAHMLLANWHAAIINNAGFIGRMIYGADEDQVFAHYGEAIRLAPADVQIRVEFARAVLELDRDANAALAREQLEAALALAPETAFERVLRGEAMKLLQNLAETRRQNPPVKR